MTLAPAPVRTWVAPRTNLPHRLPSPQWDPPYDDEPPGGSQIRSARGVLALAEPLPFALTAVGRPRPVLHLLPGPGAAPAEQPGRFAAVLVRALAEVVSGRRSPFALNDVVTLDVRLLLATLVPPGRPRHPAPQEGGGSLQLVRSVRVSEPAAGVAEVAAVLDLGGRCRAMALRLEWRSGTWIVTELDYR